MLEIDGICKAYSGHCVLEDVRFVLPAGQCLGIVGENGSGKSTLLRILAQIEKPDKGDVRYGGRSILGDRNFLRRKLGHLRSAVKVRTIRMVGYCLEVEE